MLRTPPRPFHTIGFCPVWSGKTSHRALRYRSFCPPSHAAYGRSFPSYCWTATSAGPSLHCTPTSLSWWNTSELAPLSAGTAPSSPLPTWEEVRVLLGTHHFYPGTMRLIWLQIYISESDISIYYVRMDIDINMCVYNVHTYTYIYKHILGFRSWLFMQPIKHRGTMFTQWDWHASGKLALFWIQERMMSLFWLECWRLKWALLQGCYGKDFNSKFWTFDANQF